MRSGGGTNGHFEGWQVRLRWPHLTVGQSLVFSSADHKHLIIFHNLPFADELSPLNIKSDLILNATSGIDDGFDRGVDDLPRVHVDADFVADLELPWSWTGFFFGTLYDESFLESQHS